MLADRSGMWMEDEEVCGSGGRKGTRGLMWERWKEGILEGSEWGLRGFRTVRRTLDSDKRSIQSRFTPLVQSRRDKGDPQKQIRLFRPGTTVETKSSCAGQGSFNHAEMTSEKKKVHMWETQDPSSPPSLIQIQFWKELNLFKKNNMSHRDPLGRIGRLGDF